jgi:hypothetical protein
MSTTSYKAQASMRELVDILTKEVAATLPVVTLSADASFNPIATFSADSTPAAGEKVVVIRIQPIGAPYAVDSLGNASPNYSHHVIQICTEANYAATTDNVADILTPVELLPVIAECSRRGSFVEWYVCPNGTVPDSTQFTAAQLKASFKNLYWNVLAAV